MKPPRKVKCASEDVKLARRAVKAAVSHLTSSLISHPSLNTDLAARAQELRDALRDLDGPLKDHELDVFVSEQRRKRRERLRPPKRRAA